MSKISGNVVHLSRSQRHNCSPLAVYWTTYYVRQFKYGTCIRFKHKKKTVFICKHVYEN